MRHQTISEYVGKLQAGLRDLQAKSRRVTEAYEAEISVINAEIARYIVLIDEAEKQAADETRFVALIEKQTSEQSNVRPRMRGTRSHHEKVRREKKSTNGHSKTKAVQDAAERIVRDEGKPIKRGELARRLQLNGYLAGSDNPVDLLRKALHGHDVLNFDVRRGYFIGI